MLYEKLSFSKYLAPAIRGWSSHNLRDAFLASSRYREAVAFQKDFDEQYIPLPNPILTRSSRYRLGHFDGQKPNRHPFAHSDARMCRVIVQEHRW